MPDITIGLGTTGLAALTAASTTSLLALASGAALAGAIGLGIAGIAVVATHGKKYRGRGYGGHGYGGYGGHKTHGGHGGYGGYGYKKGYGYHRKRRSAEPGTGGRHSKKVQGNSRRRRSPEQSSEAVRNLLEVIRAEDVTGCGLKLVCELAGLPEETLLEEEYAILDLIGPTVVQPGEGLLPSSGASDYAAAKEYGRLRGDCFKAFPMCPLNGTELMGAVMRFLP